MEGTRHERLIVMIASYAIGFATAFIAYGVTPYYDDSLIAVLPVNEFATHLSTAEVPSEVVEEKARLSTTLTGLFLDLGDSSRLLSANALSAAVAPSAGFHETIIDASLSGDGAYAYFCEQHTAVNGVCHPFVYNAATDSVFALTLEGTKITLDTQGNKAVWLSDGRLQIQGLTSIDAKRPWLMQ